MSDALCVAIRLGLRFAATDFTVLRERFGYSFWCGANNAKNHGERFYREAVTAGNLSACHAFEQDRGRTPFLVLGKRLFLGARVCWEGRQGVVTSFDDAAGTLVLCAYEERTTAPVKPLKRFTVTHAQLRAAFPATRTGKGTKEVVDDD
jgi:hypothetical protein